MAKMESLISSLAPGVDFTEQLGPPVTLPDAAAEQNEDANISTIGAIGGDGDESIQFPNGPGRALLLGNSHSGNTFLSDLYKPPSSADPSPVDVAEQEAENIGILLQHKIERLDLSAAGIDGSSTQIVGSLQSPDRASNSLATCTSTLVFNNTKGADSTDTADAMQISTKPNSPTQKVGNAGTSPQPPVIEPVRSATVIFPNVSHAKSVLRVPPTSRSIDPTSDADDGAAAPGDTAIFFGHSSNFMLYPQLERLSLGTSVSEAQTQKLHLVDDRCPVPEMFAEPLGPPLEEIDLQWPEPDLEDKLVEAYFEHVHSTIPLLNEAIFRDELKNRPECRQDRDWLGLALGVFSVASRFVDDERLVKHPREYASARWLLGTHWLEVRKNLGMRMFPTTLNLMQLQGVILSSYFLQATPLGGMMGWALLGVAIRLMQAHGVHRRAVNQARQLPVHIDEQWKRCFWVCYNLDVEASSSMGRPIGVHEDDFDLDFPLEVDDEVLVEAGRLGARGGVSPQNTNGNGERSTASPQSESDTASTEASTVSKSAAPSNDPLVLQGSRPCRFVTSFNATLRLDMITARILRTIYMLPKARIARGYTGSQAPQFVVAETDSALNDWINSLPPRIRFDPHERDASLLLQSSYVHMRYYNAQILTHRPFISGTRHDNPNFASVSICTNAARSCSHILDTLRKRGLLTDAGIHAVGHAFISGCLLLMVIWSARKSGARLSSSTLSDVRKCVNALSAMEHSTHPATVLGAALSEMIIAAEIPFAAYSAEQQATHKRTHADSFEDDSPSLAPEQPLSAGGAASTGSGAAGTTGSGATGSVRGRRKPKSAGVRRSANSSGASLQTGSSSSNNNRSAAASDVQPLPLSTQELVAPFFSTTSTVSTPEQAGQTPGEPSQMQHQQQSQNIQHQPGDQTPTSSTNDSGFLSQQQQFFQLQQQEQQQQRAQSGRPGSGSFGVGIPMSYGQGQIADGNRAVPLQGLFGRSGQPPMGGVSAANQRTPTVGTANNPDPLDFTSSSYDPMRIAAESADFNLVGNPASWTSSAFSADSFPAFADVSNMGMNPNAAAGGMAGLSAAMGPQAAAGAGGMGAFGVMDFGDVAGLGPGQPLPGFMGSAGFSHEMMARVAARMGAGNNSGGGGGGGGGEVPVGGERGSESVEQRLRNIDDQMRSLYQNHGQAPSMADALRQQYQQQQQQGGSENGAPNGQNPPAGNGAGLPGAQQDPYAMLYSQAFF